MRPWRDIVSSGAWAQIAHDRNTTAHVSRTTKLKSKFDASVDTPGRAIKRMTQLIDAYHRIPKTALGRFDERILALTQISRAATDYMRNFRVDADSAKQRNQLKYSGVNGWSNAPIERDQYSGRYNVGNAIDQSLDRNMLSLQNRGLRKAAYLAQLKQYYQSHSQDPRVLVAALSRPQEKGADFTGLTAGVRMEALDPWHRPVEVSFGADGRLEDSDEMSDVSSSVAFSQWYASIGQHNLPFFLWLEGHPICVADDKDLVAGTASVTYVTSVDAGNGYATIAARHKLCMVYPHGGKLWLDELKPNGVTRVADTDGYVCNSGKGVTDAAAFMWTGREITVAQHQESGFHHSSFNAGGAVRCAGMIKIKSGYITYVSNNSGHYRPGKNLLHRFVADMHRRGLIAPDCTVHCAGLATKYHDTAQHFLTHWATL